jgi:hypothetical protein
LSVEDGGSVWQIFYRPEEGEVDHVIFDWRQFSHFYGAPRANPRSPKTIPIYAKASVGHPLISEIRRSMAHHRLQRFYPELRIFLHGQGRDPLRSRMKASPEGAFTRITNSAMERML